MACESHFVTKAMNTIVVGKTCQMVDGQEISKWSNVKKPSGSPESVCGSHCLSLTYQLPTTATISYYCQTLLLATVAATDILPTSNHLSFSLSTQAR